VAPAHVPSLFAYLHRLDPVIIRFTDSIQLRWYGVAYVLGFLAGFWLLRRWARKGTGVLAEKEVGDFITYGALFGVLLGGRLGYILLYDRAAVAGDPLRILRVWDGGMASHGGIAGLFLFTLYWARRHRVSWTGLGDSLVAVAPVGLFAGRMANFINGELYGRSTDVSWAMKFPEEALRILDTAPVGDPRADAIATLMQDYRGNGLSLKELVLQNDGFAAQLEPLLTARHPSQLYAGALEGVALFAILFFVREKWPRAPHGLVTALFFLGYAGFRIFDEQFREPDAHIMGLTEGQFYSLPLIALGFAFLAFTRWPQQMTAVMPAFLRPRPLVSPNAES
jgi:phosphatidylglycerol---prolipoprotein diacylglyceryl transferase